jgi:transketolase
MEGISAEAASLAGHLKLANLCWIYDNNRITIEGNTALAFTDDVATRFIGYGWNVTRVGDANDREMLARAFETFRREDERPTLIIVDSHIATARRPSRTRAAPTASRWARRRSASPSGPTAGPRTRASSCPDGVREHFADGIGARGRGLRGAWMERFEAYSAEYPELGRHLWPCSAASCPRAGTPTSDVRHRRQGLAGREASGKVLNAIARDVPWLIGGAADLAPSTKTRLTFEGAGDFSAEDRGGRNLHFGVREHAMSAAVNGWRSRRCGRSAPGS